MSYRPYPDADRSRHQVNRHNDETPPRRHSEASLAMLVVPQALTAAANASMAIRSFAEDLRNVRVRTEPIVIRKPTPLPAGQTPAWWASF